MAVRELPCIEPGLTVMDRIDRCRTTKGNSNATSEQENNMAADKKSDKPLRLTETVKGAG